MSTEQRMGEQFRWPLPSGVTGGRKSKSMKKDIIRSEEPLYCHLIATAQRHNHSAFLAAINNLSAIGTTVFSTTAKLRCSSSGKAVADPPLCKDSVVRGLSAPKTVLDSPFLERLISSCLSSRSVLIRSSYTKAVSLQCLSNSKASQQCQFVSVDFQECPSSRPAALPRASPTHVLSQRQSLKEVELRSQSTPAIVLSCPY
ncbi:hypothetical protein ACOMHN_044929 [Nucella lapillus]